MRVFKDLVWAFFWEFFWNLLCLIKLSACLLNMSTCINRFSKKIEKWCGTEHMFTNKCWDLHTMSPRTIEEQTEKELQSGVAFQEICYCKIRTAEFKSSLTGSLESAHGWSYIGVYMKSRFEMVAPFSFPRKWFFRKIPVNQSHQQRCKIPRG